MEAADARMSAITTTPSLTQRAAEGAASMTIVSVLALGLQFVVQVAVTYILTREQIGAWGLAMPVMMFASIFQQAGVREVLIHRRASFRRWSNAGFWLSSLLGGAGGLAVLASAYPLSQAYQSGVLFPLIALLAFSPIMAGACIVPEAKLSADLRFHAVASAYLFGSLAGSGILLLTAWAGFGPYSYALGALATVAVRGGIVWALARPAVRLDLQVRRWRFMLRDMGLVFGANSLRWFTTFGDAMILGLFAPKGVVAVYYFAYSVSIIPFRIITLNLGGVLLPALSTLQRDVPRQLRAFLRASRTLAFIGFPICFGMAATADLFVGVFLDRDKWHDLPPVLAVMSVGMAFRLVQTPAESMWFAQGRFRASFLFSAGSAGLLALVAFAAGQSGSALVMASAIAALACFLGPFQLYLAIRRPGGTVRDALRVFVVPAAMSLGAIGPARLWVGVVADGTRLFDAVAFVLMVCTAAALYTLLAALLGVPEYREALERLEALSPRPLKPLYSVLCRISGR